VNEAAMIRALKSGQLAGAGCDVFETEPLPSESELYDLSNVIVSPHMAGLTPHLVDRAVKLFCENLRRFLRQEPLLYPVDLRRGF
jgi:phosphoglycerate dehydrogenase-like enzyme